MSSKKTIAINPELFSLSGGSKKKNDKAKTQKKREKKFNFVNPNQLRKNLLNKIKEHKEKSEKGENIINSHQTTIKNKKMNKTEVNNNNESDNIEKFSSNFKDSMNYLSDLVKKEKKEKPKRKRRQRSLKKHGGSSFNPDQIEVNLKLPDEFNMNLNKPEPQRASITPPPWGCLKGGDKPTFRQWKNNTQKNYNISISDDEDDEDETFENDMKDISTISTISKEQDEEEEEEEEIKIKKEEHENIINSRKEKLERLRKKNNFITKKTLRRKYKLGKSKKGDRVSILIKSTQTKKKIMDEKKKIEGENMNNIKKYLREHNLIRAGSSSPNDVLKTMYESSILSGFVQNNSEDVALHNYLNN